MIAWRHSDADGTCINITDREPEDRPADLVYGLNDRPPLRLSAVVALQHVLAVFVGVVTPPLLISRALELPAADAAFLVSMALLMSGVGTLVQTRRFGIFGSGLLSIQGTSFVFVGPIIALARSVAPAGGSWRESLGVVFGVCLAASFVPMLIGPFIHRAQRVITPLVTGIVVTLIGLTLVSVGMTSVGGGFEARHDGSFGSAYNLGLALAVIVSIVSLNNSRREWLRMVSIAAGLGAGYAIAILAGQVSLAGLSDLPRFTLPAPFRYGLGFRATALIPFAFLYLITAVESIGDITATSLLVAEPITGAAYFRRLRGGVMADGVNSMLAAIFNSFPSTTFAQNNGVIQLTGVGSRRIGTLVGGLLIVMGMFPMVGGVIQAMPASVLGGATILMFGTVAVAGIRILSGIAMDRRASTIAALSFGFGLGITFVPDVTASMPPFLRDMFSSGIATGGLCALGLNALLPGKRA